MLDCGVVWFAAVSRDVASVTEARGYRVWRGDHTTLCNLEQTNIISTHVLSEHIDNRVSLSRSHLVDCYSNCSCSSSNPSQLSQRAVCPQRGTSLASGGPRAKGARTERRDGSGRDVPRPCGTTGSPPEPGMQQSHGIFLIF